MTAATAAIYCRICQRSLTRISNDADGVASALHRRPTTQLHEAFGRWLRL
jgi:hypothetical protein